MQYRFIHDQRLGISLPQLETEWENYSPACQDVILEKWEEIRGKIPERIQEIENTINKKQAMLDKEEDFETSCRLNLEIAELASLINDLWIWYRTTQHITLN
ncbi:hypothetical protein ACFPU1_08305 [Thalassorhabdus alkalitolerans]|uniref:Uncharacterized protein n=1 Tax=Thalassorhabdus alkalitolerans TaxID=2282697 RepID=A0ABW0YMV8_9BACI